MFRIANPKSFARAAAGFRRSAAHHCLRLLATFLAYQIITELSSQKIVMFGAWGAAGYPSADGQDGGFLIRR